MSYLILCMSKSGLLLRTAAVTMQAYKNKRGEKSIIQQPKNKPNSFSETDNTDRDTFCFFFFTDDWQTEKLMVRINSFLNSRAHTNRLLQHATS